MMLTPFQHFVVGAIRAAGKYTPNASSVLLDLHDLCVADVIYWDVAHRAYLAGPKFAEV